MRLSGPMMKTVEALENAVAALEDELADTTD